MSVDPPVVANESFLLEGGGIPGDVGPQGPIGPQGPLGPKGDPGGWVNAASIPDGTDLNTLTTAGMYFKSSSTGTSLALNYPESAWAGWIEVTTSGTSNMQRATAISSNPGATGLYQNAWVRTRVSGTWGPWYRVDLTDHLKNADPHTQYFKKYGDGNFSGDFNAMNIPGNYLAIYTATMVAERNAPVTTGGYLEVYATAPAVIIQRYTVNSDSHHLTWSRSSSNTGATWSAWRNETQRHEAATDPHSQYMPKTTQSGQLAGVLTSPGTYQVGGGIASTANGYPPSAGYPGVLNVSGQGTHRTQVFTFEAGPIAGQTWLRTTANTGTTWTEWELLFTPKSAPRPGKAVVGTGFPSFSAPVGTRYTDTDATNGAVEWIKASGTGTTGWKVVYGDTGWRSVPTDKPNVTGDVLYRRIGEVVYFDSTGLTVGGTASSPESIIIPMGFRTRPSRALYGQNGAPPLKLIATGSAISLYGLSVNQTVQIPMFGHVTVDAWPATLPGTAA